MRIVAVIAVVVFVTLPFGFYRAYTRKLSLRWFLAIHIPVILVFVARFESHLSYAYIPVTFAAFAAAQIVGARAGRWWMRRRPGRLPKRGVTPPESDGHTPGPRRHA